MSLSFETLPPEILATVCEILASEHLPTLQALSLANQHCCALANSYRFQNIHFAVDADDRFLVDIQNWERVLKNMNGFHTVRRLSVDGHPPSSRYKELDPSDDISTPGYFQTSFSVEDEWFSFEARYFDLLHLQNVIDTGDGIEDFNITTPAQLDAWRPLSGFLQILQGLKSLVWLNTSQFPPCLLEVLHRHLPSCRLHIRGFKFDSLYLQTEEPYAINAHESALATSPSLASIVCTIRQDWGSFVNNKAAVMQMAAGAAPNLTELYIKKWRYSDPDTDPPVEVEPRDLFVGFPKTISGLRSLSLNDPSFYDIERWNGHVLFSNFEMLQVETACNFTVLSKVAEYCFANLQSLILRLCTFIDTEGRFDRLARLDNDASILLSRLPPLKRLLLQCYYTKECANTALEPHGKTLEKLGMVFLDYDSFGARTTPQIVDEIQSSCPNLRHLALRIPRSNGNAAEVSIYRALGRISSLRHLAIELDCSKEWHRFLRPSMLGGDRNIPADNPHIKEALINAAVDETLIRSILDIVAGPGSSLRALKVEIFLGDIPGGLRRITSLMQSTWEVDRFLDGAFVRKTDHWRKRDDIRSGMPGGANKWLEETSGYSKPFRNLWPAKGDSWLDDWHSFPRQLD
jgi:hypothetical protein